MFEPLRFNFNTWTFYLDNSSLICNLSQFCFHFKHLWSKQLGPLDYTISFFPIPNSFSSAHLFIQFHDSWPLQVFSWRNVQANHRNLANLTPENKKKDKNLQLAKGYFQFELRTMHNDQTRFSCVEAFSNLEERILLLASR